jgi:spore germination protein GerM
VSAPAAAVAAALLAACGRAKGPAAPAAAQSTPGAAAPATAEPASPAPSSAPLATAAVTLWFPSASKDELAPETREIVDVKAPADRGAQIVAALIEGPKTAACLPAVPPGTALRRLWVRDDGNAYADFSEELASSPSGGSADEILMVYSIVDSLTENVPAIRRVGLLVGGHEREILGHLDVRRPIPPDPSLAPKPAPSPPE